MKVRTGVKVDYTHGAPAARYSADRVLHVAISVSLEADGRAPVVGAVQAALRDGSRVAVESIKAAQ